MKIGDDDRKTKNHNRNCRYKNTDYYCCYYCYYESLLLVSRVFIFYCNLTLMTSISVVVTIISTTSIVRMIE